MSALLKVVQKGDNYLFPESADKILEVQHRVHEIGEEFLILVLVLSQISCHHE